MQTELESSEDEARRTIVRALNRDPYDVWTRDRLATTLGLSAGLTGKVLAQLADAGIVHRLGDASDGFTVAGGDD